ncbi:hypothetical protein BRC96_06905 [Halobacteriales archaeon QS_6_64_34]|nr:MAG: hypothetical protein BRC96_06905 [Halobacteriales archaeon QS_6_64_34]
MIFRNKHDGYLFICFCNSRNNSIILSNSNLCFKFFTAESFSQHSANQNFIIQFTFVIFFITTYHINTNTIWECTVCTYYFIHIFIYDKFTNMGADCISQFDTIGPRISS